MLQVRETKTLLYEREEDETIFRLVAKAVDDCIIAEAKKELPLFSLL